MQAIHFPERTPRRTQQALSQLERAGLVAHVDVRRSPRRVWFLTELGADWVMDAGADREPKVLGPEQAAGPLRAHTLGVNEVGISFLRAARKRGDEFSSISWRHEVAHPLNRGRGRARRALITDAVFTYASTVGQDFLIEQRFVEVDRATLSVERLAAELARYGELEHAREKTGGQRIWKRYYRRFPPVICALTGAKREALFRRLDVVLNLLFDHPALTRSYSDVAIYFCLLDDLMARGPFAPVFYKLDALNHPVDWLGKPKDGQQ
ncbi:MAG: replication-relaxation family protein [Solirubrobacterales bacterium]